MTDERPGPTDRAIETATDRTKAAEDEFLETPVTDEAAIVRAAKVERRADDLAALTADPSEDDPPYQASIRRSGVVRGRISREWDVSALASGRIAMHHARVGHSESGHP